MKINRAALLKVLATASIGLTKTEVLEQSDCFTFLEGKLITFNDEILTRSESPLDFDAVVPVADFVQVLKKFPDEEVDVSLKSGEVVIKGKRRSAGVTVHAESLLPFDAVPSPGKWRTLKEGVVNALQQAARICGRDHAHPLTTVVHVTKGQVQACDNFRLFRSELKTGFPSEIMIPASTVLQLGGIALEKVSVSEGWVHFRVGGEGSHEVSARCSQGSYADVDGILYMSESEEVKLPDNLGEMVDRAEIMAEGDRGASLIGVKIDSGSLELTARKDGGWFKEKKRVNYDGPSLAFEINPRFLVEALKRSNVVEIGDGKMKLETEETKSQPATKFVVCLEA